MNFTLRLSLSGLVALTACQTSFAQTEPSIPRIVVTPTLSARTVDDSLSSVTIIDSKTIDQSAASTADELLNTVPSLNITRSGGIGQNISVFLRGTESDHTLILLNGVKISSATTGAAALNNIPTSVIERIEIVRGPRSSLYGSEAIGGVIQIFTKKGAKGFQPSFSVSSGSHSTHKTELGFSGGDRDNWVRGQIAKLESNGINACNGKPGLNGGGCFTDESDKDGYENQSFNLAAGFKAAENLRIGVTALKSDGSVDYDGSFSNEADNVQTVFATSLDFQTSDTGALVLQLGRSEDKNTNFLNGAFTSSFITDRDTAALHYSNKAAEKTRYTTGVDYENVKVSGSTEYAVNERDNKAAFVAVQQDMGASSLEASLRRDDNEQFGGKTTGSIAFGYDLSNKVRLSTSYGTAFKAPSFNELYFPGFSNANLAPEESKTFDLGARFTHKASTAGITLFQTEIDDLITFDAATNAPANVDEATIKGIELSASTLLGFWTVGADYTLLDTENELGFNAGKTLARRPDSIANLSLSRAVGDWTLGAKVHKQSSSYDDASNSVKLDGFTTLDLSAGYVINPSWNVNLSLNNVTDESYETARYYNQDGLNGFVRVNYAGL